MSTAAISMRSCAWLIPCSSPRSTSVDAGELEARRDVIISGSVNDDDAKKLFPEGWRSPKPYIRIVKQPA